jgi:hypothetical protein
MNAWLLSILIFFSPAVLRAIDSSTDDVKNYLSSARDKARAWQPDSELVYVTIGSSVKADGSNLCAPDRPTTGWNYAFYSKTADAYYTVYGCKGTVTAEPTGKGFQTPPPAITQDFIGTHDVLDVLQEIAHRQHQAHCQSVQALRTGEEKVPVWSTMLDCGDVGASVVIDATSGKILKNKWTS